MSESLRLLKTNERPWAIRSFLLISSFLVSDVSESLISLKSNEGCEWIAHFTHQKWATMSDALRSLRGNERCERIVHFAHQKWVNEWIAHFFEQIAHSLIFVQKTSDLLGKQMSEFPALIRVDGMPLSNFDPPCPSCCSISCRNFWLTNRSRELYVFFCLDESGWYPPVPQCLQHWLLSVQEQEWGSRHEEWLQAVRLHARERLTLISTGVPEILSYALQTVSAGLYTRIRIHFPSWIRIRIQERKIYK